MALISLLRRNRLLRPSATGDAVEVVELTYSTTDTLPRYVHLPLELYRPATEDELAANPRYQMLPVDPAAEDQEKLEIARDMKAAHLLPPDTFELP